MGYRLSGFLLCFWLPHLAIANTLQVKGINRSGEPQLVVIRIDDRESPPYADRFNGEHWVLPGPFEIQQTLSNLRAVNGRILETPYQQTLVFSPSSKIEVQSQQKIEIPQLDAILAFDFGEPDNVELGFSAPPTDPLITFDRGRAQSNPDPLTRDGARVPKQTLPLVAGRYWIALWLDDSGAWEWVPYYLQRTVSLDGQILLDEAISEADWRRRYASFAPDYPELIDSLAQPTLIAPIDVGDQPELAIASDHAAGKFIAGLVIAESQASLEQLIQQRRDRLSRAWPITPKTIRSEFGPLSSSERFALGEWRFFELPPDSEVSGSSTLDVQVYSRQRQLRRHQLSGNLLMHTEDRLHPDVNAGPYGGVLAIRGRTSGQFSLQVDQNAVEVHIHDLTRPLPKPVGLFWEAPFWISQQYPGDPNPFFEQFLCDQAQLNDWGLKILAPSWPLPLEADTAEIFSSMQDPDVVSYAEWRRLPDNPDGILRALSPSPISLLDEPSNTRNTTDDLMRTRERFDGIRLAGFLNNPRDLPWIAQLDRSYLNDGFGLNPKRLRSLASQGHELWLYNIENPRWGAGLALQQEALNGAVFWHARLPTAWPGNPTDGRETDISWIGDPTEICEPLKPSAQLFRLVQGVEDQRWARWAQQQGLPVTQSQSDSILKRWRANLIEHTHQ